MTNARKFITASIAALTLGAAVVATASPAEARWGRNGAFFGGLAVGALALGAVGATAYNYGPTYVSSCHLERRPMIDSWGNVVGFRRVRICE
jgi:hypothetical protein